MLDDAMQLPYFRLGWKPKLVMLSVAWRSVWAFLTRKQWVTAGAALQGRMFQAALRTGVDIRTDAPATELIIEDGAVKGVATVKNGRPWRVGAKLGVLVNAGGFARNQEMRDRYQPGTSAQWSNVTPGDTGEMIEEMMRHGRGNSTDGRDGGFPNDAAAGK